MNLGDALELASWRREVAALYSAIRSDPEPAHAHEHWRLGRDELFARHPQSPLAAGDARRRDGLSYFRYDLAWRFVVGLRPNVAMSEYRIDTDDDEVTRLRPVGLVDLPAPIGSTLVVYELAQYGGGIFLPFRDATSSGATYGGGRYLLDYAKGADLGEKEGGLVLDFNFSYHPSCAYDPRWRCPLAPLENRLKVPVLAGEHLGDRARS